MDITPHRAGKCAGNNTEIMRTIKFRAWNKTRKEMYNIHGWHSEFVFKDTLDGISTEGNPDRVEDVEIMQFTGLYDKSGREIYEGDIVRVDCSPVGGAFEDGVYIVAYVLPDCAYCLESVDKKSTIEFNECYEYEVIGNIHENPELLNQKPHENHPHFPTPTVHRVVPSTAVFAQRGKPHGI